MLGESQDRFGRFGEETSVGLFGIRTPRRPDRSLVTVQSRVEFLFILVIYKLASLPSSVHE